MSALIERINSWVEQNRDTCITFLQGFIAAPSPSRNEREAAEYLAEGMRQFGFNVVKVDELFDVMGTIKGQGKGKTLLLNGHIDHVPAGEMVDPWSGKVLPGEPFGERGEVIYGRAACDMKAAVAAMVLAGAMLNDLGIELEGDYKVAGVALEEVGGAGTMSTITDSQFLGDVVLIGEATNMQLALGHRGSMKMTVVVKGRSCHASAPERGINALYKAIKMIEKIRTDIEPVLPNHPIYGRTSLVVTQIEVSPKATNVVPEECIFHIDCRHSPNFTHEDLYNSLKQIVTELQTIDPEFEATVLPSPIINEKRFSGFYTDPAKFSIVAETVDTIKEIYKEPELGVWTFATDGRIYSRLGIPVIGFGPGEEKYAHTQEDHVRVNDYLDTIKVYGYLACKICGININS